MSKSIAERGIRAIALLLFLIRNQQLGCEFRELLRCRCRERTARLENTALHLFAVSAFSQRFQIFLCEFRRSMTETEKTHSQSLFQWTDLFVRKVAIKRSSHVVKTEELVRFLDFCKPPMEPMHHQWRQGIVAERTDHPGVVKIHNIRNHSRQQRYSLFHDPEDESAPRGAVWHV